jgi:hypothetical protein
MALCGFAADCIAELSFFPHEYFLVLILSIHEKMKYPPPTAIRDAYLKIDPTRLHPPLIYA